MKHNVILSFDTTGTQDSISIEIDGKVETIILPRGGRSQHQSAFLVPELQAILSRKGSSLKEVNTLCTFVGPGSFTGIRIGLATALGIHLANRCEIFAPTVLDLLFHMGKSKINEIPLLAVVDSKRGDYFSLSLEEFAPQIRTHDQIVSWQKEGGEVISSEPIQGLTIVTLDIPMAEALIIYYHDLTNSNNLKEKERWKKLVPFYIRTPEFTQKKSSLICS